MKLLQTHVVLGWSAILLLGLADYGLAATANPDSTDMTKSSSAEVDLDSTSSDNSDSMTTEPAEVTTPALDKKGILEKIQAKLGEIRELLEKLKSLFVVTTTIAGDLSTDLSTMVVSDITSEVSTTKGSDITAETSTGVPTTVASEGTTVISTGVPTTVASEGTTVMSTEVPTTVASEGTTVMSTGVPTTVASEGTTVMSTGVSTTVSLESITVARTVISTNGAVENEISTEESKELKAEEIDNICNPSVNDACSKLKDAIVSVETFTSNFDPTGDVSTSDLEEVNQATSNLNEAVTMVAKDPSGVNPEALNTKLASVEQSIVSAETKISNEIQVLDDPGTDNTVAIVLGTLGGLLVVAIVATLVIRMKKKKKAAKKAAKKTINEDA